MKTKNHISSCSLMVIYRLSFTDYVIKYSEERETVFLHYICEEMRERKSERAGEKQRKKVQNAYVKKVRQKMPASKKKCKHIKKMDILKLQSTPGREVKWTRMVG